MIITGLNAPRCYYTFIETISIPCKKKVSMPLGVRCEQNKMLSARIYSESRLFKVIRETSYISLYPVVNSLYFYYSLKKRLDDILDIDAFDSCYVVSSLNDYRVKVEVSGLIEHDNAVNVYFKPVNWSDAMAKLEMGYTRADGCLMELMVQYTKLKARIISEDAYRRYCDVCRTSITRSTVNPMYLRILDELQC